MGVFVIIGLGIAVSFGPPLIGITGGRCIIAFLPLVFAVYFGTWAIRPCAVHTVGCYGIARPVMDA